MSVRILMGIFMMVFLCGCNHHKELKDLMFSGTMEMTEHVLGAKVPARLSTLKVTEGDTVKAGQLLATLDRFDQTQKDYQRSEALYQSGGGSSQAVEYAQLAMQDQEIISPLNGIVLVKAAETGEILPAGGGVVVIGDPKDQWVKVFVSEDLIHQLTLGQKATVSLDGTNQKYHGHVTFIADKAEFTPRNVQTPEERVTQTFAVKITIDDPDAHLHAGVAADVKFGDIYRDPNSIDQHGVN